MADNGEGQRTEEGESGAPEQPTGSPPRAGAPATAEDADAVAASTAAEVARGGGHIITRTGDHGPAARAVYAAVKKARADARPETDLVSERNLAPTDPQPSTALVVQRGPSPVARALSTFVWFLRSLIPAALVRRWAERQTEALLGPLQEAAEDPTTTQRQLLKEILDDNADCDFGRAHGFSAIDTPIEYARKVPIRTAAEYRPYVERVAAGERDVLVYGTPAGLTISWGTRGLPLPFPVSRRTEAAAKRQATLALLSVLRVAPRTYPGKALLLPPPSVQRDTLGGLRREDVPGALWMPPEIALLPTLEARWYATVRLAMGEPITTLVALSPSAILHLGTVLDRYGPELLGDIARGTLRPPGMSDTPALTLKNPDRLAPRPQLAARLREHVRVGRVLRPLDLWPRLGAVVCRRSGQAARYLPTLDALLPDIPVVDPGYSSAQGVIAVPGMDLDGPPLLDLTAAYIELLPADEAEGEGTRVEIADARPGYTYRLVLTTTNGVYRYELGDHVEVLFTDNGPALRLSGRAPVRLSAAGEKVSEMQVEIAMKQASSDTAISLAGFAVSFAPRGMDHKDKPVPARYIVAVEPRAEETDSHLHKLIDVFDKALSAQNPRYAERRERNRLGPPVLWVWKPGAIDAHRERRAASGAPDPLLEPPVVAPDPGILEELAVDRKLV